VPASQVVAVAATNALRRSVAHATDSVAIELPLARTQILRSFPEAAIANAPDTEKAWKFLDRNLNEMWFLNPLIAGKQIPGLEKPRKKMFFRLALGDRKIRSKINFYVAFSLSIPNFSLC
jgi:hypothetical protein